MLLAHCQNNGLFKVQYVLKCSENLEILENSSHTNASLYDGTKEMLLLVTCVHKVQGYFIILATLIEFPISYHQPGSTHSQPVLIQLCGLKVSPATVCSIHNYRHQNIVARVPSLSNFPMSLHRNWCPYKQLRVGHYICGMCMYNYDYITKYISQRMSFMIIAC